MTVKIEPVIHESWKLALEKEFNSAYFHELKQFLQTEKQSGKTIYPPGRNIFEAFNLTPLDQIKVVILGQDPYHGPGQAHGLSFSVMEGIRQPPSLQNIFKELHSDLGIPIPATGDLSKWAKQGVFLLNAILTVEARLPASHQKRGWEQFTDAVIRSVCDKCEGVVFILWGKFAQGKHELIDKTRHHIISSPHPSPYSADRGFFGSKPFSRANEILKKLGKEPVDWSL